MFTPKSSFTIQVWEPRLGEVETKVATFKMSGELYYMTPSYTHASESYVLIGHESALFHILHVSPRFLFNAPFPPFSYLVVNTWLIVLRIMW
jgi:hypothetical protein